MNLSVSSVYITSSHQANIYLATDDDLVLPDNSYTQNSY